jgi:hypothetical protein
MQSSIASAWSHARWRAGSTASALAGRRACRPCLADEPTALAAALRERLASDKLVLAFVAEFSRGKSELINAIFFADAGRRILPATPGAHHDVPGGAAPRRRRAAAAVAAAHRDPLQRPVAVRTAGARRAWQRCRWTLRPEALARRCRP